MHDVRLMRDVCNNKAARYDAQRHSCAQLLFEAYVAHYYRVNKPPKIHKCDSVIVLTK